MVPPATSGSQPRLLDQLPRDHLLRELIGEHAALLAHLDRLDELLEELRDDAGTPHARSVAAEIRTIAAALMAAETHHRKEEEVLFPAMVEAGIAQPPRVMVREHEELRAMKRRLVRAAEVDHPDSEEVAEAAGTLAGMLRDHIHNENEVLYPMAFAVLRDRAVWDRLRAAAAEIGAKSGACCDSCRCEGSPPPR